MKESGRVFAKKKSSPSSSGNVLLKGKAITLKHIVLYINYFTIRFVHVVSAIAALATLDQDK